MKRATPVLVLLAACGAAPAPAIDPPRAAAPTTTERGAGFRFEVTVGEGARELQVEAQIPPECRDELRLDQGTEPFLRAVEVDAGAGFVPLAPVRSTDGEGGAYCFRLPPCPPAGCRLRYRFALAEAAAARGTLVSAARHQGTLVSPPSAWLLHPVDPPDGQRFDLRVHTPPDLVFTTGLFRAPGDDVHRYAADLSDLSRAPYSAFGALRVLVVDVVGQRIELAFPPGAFTLSDEALLGWVEGNARIIADHYGRAPLPRTMILLLPEEGRGVRFGQVLGNGGASIVVRLGRSTRAEDLDPSWELLHEMLHTAFPSMPTAQAWLQEGMATYLEPLLRARRGLITAEEAFHRLSRRMEHGLPAPGDRGLDHTPTWGRTYWGGALFCLLADLEIRKRSEGRRSLDDGLRAIVEQGGNVADRWSIERVIAVADAGTGHPVLAELHAKMGSAPVTVDLPGLWRELGVIPGDEGARLDDGARSAAIRRAMVRGR